MKDEQKWFLVSTAAGAAAGFLVRNAIEMGWKYARGEDPPKNPASYDVAWKDAIAWTVTVGVCMGLGRLVAERAAASGWKRYRGRFPPMHS
ncbi:MAG: DUF4235 domain-containing protein [Longimicrobiales bacterium]